MEFKEEKCSPVSSLNIYNIGHMEMFKSIISYSLRSDKLLLPKNICAILSSNLTLYHQRVVVETYLDLREQKTHFLHPIEFLNSGATELAALT